MSGNRVTSGVLCPLCGARSRIFPWRPEVPWISIEGCFCGAYVIRAALLRRLIALGVPERGHLHARVAALRALQLDAWVTTVGDRPNGPLEVRSGRPPG